MNYQVKLAKHQPFARRNDSCDNCLGTALEKYRLGLGIENPLADLPEGGYRFATANVFRDGTERVYNVLLPGEGNQQFVLHPDCAEYISNEGVNPAEARLAVHPCCGVAVVDSCQC